MDGARSTRRDYDLSSITRSFGLSKSTRVGWTRRHYRRSLSNCASVIVYLWIKITHSRTALWVSPSFDSCPWRKALGRLAGYLLRQRRTSAARICRQSAIIFVRLDPARASAMFPSGWSSGAQRSYSHSNSHSSWPVGNRHQSPFASTSHAAPRHITAGSQSRNRSHRSIHCRRF